MTNKLLNQDARIHYLYRVTNKINGKIYIGQTVDPSSRWRGHKRDAIDPKIPFHYAIRKYGDENFEFEVIASCKGQDNANELETELVSQYDSFVNNEKGYNATHGGMNAPKSEAWKQAMRDWHASMSYEEKEERSKILSEAAIQQIATKGHPAQGHKWTDDQKSNLSVVLKALDKEAIYTPEVRQNMSEAHIGIKDSEETKVKKSESAKIYWENHINYDDIKCAAPGCEISGKAAYRIINEIRYCVNHGTRLLRHDGLDKLPVHIQKNQSDEERKKCGVANIGRIASNRHHFEPPQIDYILNCGKSIRALSREFKITEKVIKRVKEGKY